MRRTPHALDDRGIRRHREQAAGDREILEEERSLRLDSELVMEDERGEQTEDGKSAGSVAPSPAREQRKSPAELQRDHGRKQQRRNSELGHVIEERLRRDDLDDARKDE